MAAEEEMTAAAEAVEQPRETRKLFVGGVAASAQEADLLGSFARFGAVRSVMVMRERESGHGRGFGFVEFKGEDAAARALGAGYKPRHDICSRWVVDRLKETPWFQGLQQPA